MAGAPKPSSPNGAGDGMLTLQASKVVVSVRECSQICKGSHWCRGETLDFESSASANSASPALRDWSERIRDSRASSTSWCCRARSPQRILFARKDVSVEDSGHYSRSSVRKPRGGPRISRRIIALRKPDVDASNVAMSVLRTSALAIVGATSA